jgi:hypothetical protein
VASIEAIAVAAPWAFCLGLALGFVVGARFRIERRDGHE